MQTLYSNAIANTMSLSETKQKLIFSEIYGKRYSFLYSTQKVLCQLANIVEQKSTLNTYYANILIACNFDIRRSNGAKNEDLSELRDDSRRIG